MYLIFIKELSALKNCIIKDCLMKDSYTLSKVESVGILIDKLYDTIFV